MEEGKMMIPYVVYESEQARNERTVKRLVTALITAIVVIFICNAAWLYSWMQYDYVYEDTITLESDNKSSANFIGGSGVISNGGTDYSLEEESENEE